MDPDLSFTTVGTNTSSEDELKVAVAACPSCVLAGILDRAAMVIRPATCKGRIRL